MVVGWVGESDGWKMETTILNNNKNKNKKIKRILCVYYISIINSQYMKKAKIDQQYNFII